jgi:hypothetical protein
MRLSPKIRAKILARSQRDREVYSPVPAVGGIVIQGKNYAADLREFVLLEQSVLADEANHHTTAATTATMYGALPSLAANPP